MSSSRSPRSSSMFMDNSPSRPAEMRSSRLGEMESPSTPSVLTADGHHHHHHSDHHADHHNHHNGSFSSGGSVGAMFVWLFMIFIVIWFVLFSFRPPQVLNCDGEIDTGKIVLLSLIPALVIVLLIWVFKSRNRY